MDMVRGFKRNLLLLLIAAGMLAATDGARAESLVYIDAGEDLAAARPDGSAARKLVTDTGGTGPNAPAVDSRGRIAYFYGAADGLDFHRLIDKDGKALGGPYLFDMPLCGSVSPFRSAFSPDGTWIAATYVRGNSCDSSGFELKTRLIDDDGPTANEIYGSFAGLYEPRFLRQSEPQLAGVIDDTINVWQSPEIPTMQPWIGLSDPASWDIDSFDLHPQANRMIMEQSPEGTPEGGERRDILLLSYTTPAGPTSVPTGICSLDGLVASSDVRARPRFSPDGSKIAWSGPQGIYISPAPTAGAGGICSLSPELVVPGGSEVEWAPFSLTTSGPGPGPVAGKLSITGASGTNRKGFRKGASVKVKVPAAGLVRVTATVPKAVAKKLKLVRKPAGAVKVAGGSKSAAGAGQVSVKLKPTGKVKAAWKKLAGVKVTLKAVQGSKRASKVIKLTR